jgi:hypothetical protein
MLYAAVHFLLLRGSDHGLRLFYPNLNAGNARRDLENAFSLFRNFVASHRAQIAQLISSRVTNTNEVGRSAVLNAGFRALASVQKKPLHLIELGPSAGVNLIWDRYAIEYRRNGDTVMSGPPDAPLVIETELRGNTYPPSGSRGTSRRAWGSSGIPSIWRIRMSATG